jgi:ribosomal protein L16 Arg81 hydroxylase
VLEAGDLLYLPQGWRHEAVAETDGCMHLSFALVHLRLDDVARALLRALADADADTAQPLYDLHLGAPAMAAHIGEVLRRVQAQLADETFAATLLRSVLDTRRSRLRHQLPVRRPPSGSGQATG